EQLERFAVVFDLEANALQICRASCRSLRYSPSWLTANPSATLITMKTPSSNQAPAFLPEGMDAAAGVSDSTRRFYMARPRQRWPTNARARSSSGRVPSAAFD